MDFFYFLVGLILGVFSMSGKKLLYIFQIILCLGTTFLILKILNPAIFILPINRWSWINLLYGNNYFFMGFISFIFSGFVFYWAIPNLIKKIFIKKIENLAEGIFIKYSKYDFKKIKKFIYRILLIEVKFLMKMSWKHPQKKNYKDELSYEKYIDSIILFFSIIIHFTIVWFTFFNFNYSTLILFIILFIISLYFLFYSPFYKRFFSFIFNIVTYEYNRNITKISH